MDLEGSEGIAADIDKFIKKYVFQQSPPEPILPPVHPLIAVQKAHIENKEARIKLMLKKIFLERNETEANIYSNNSDEQNSTLKQQFILSNDGIKENKASMSRFYEIINEEKKTRITLKREIELTKMKIEDYKKVQQDLTNYVRIYSMYENFLGNVAEVGQHLRSVRDILNRFETLLGTSMECSKLLGDELEQSVDLKRQMTAVVEEKLEKMKTLNNRLILLQVRSKESRDKRDHWEHMVGRIKNTILDRTEEALSLSGGIYDLYHSMCKRLQVVAEIPIRNIETQLDFIHKTILFYKEVIIIATSSKTIQPIKKLGGKRRRSIKKK